MNFDIYINVSKKVYNLYLFFKKINRTSYYKLSKFLKIEKDSFFPINSLPALCLSHAVVKGLSKMSIEND